LEIFSRVDNWYHPILIVKKDIVAVKVSVHLGDPNTDGYSRSSIPSSGGKGSVMPRLINCALRDWGLSCGFWTMLGDVKDEKSGSGRLLIV